MKGDVVCGFLRWRMEKILSCMGEEDLYSELGTLVASI
jgi:hypothetical protein